MTYIFIHGLGQTKDSFNETIKLLNIEEYVSLDLKELLDGKEVTYDNLYKEVSTYINNLDSKVVLCGLSLGGVLALNYTIDNPNKVDSLIVIGTQYKMPKRLLQFQNTIFKCMPSKIFDNLGFNKKDFIKLTKSMEDLDFSNNLRDITCNTLILCGDKDRLNMRAAKYLALHINNATFGIIKNAKHAANTHNPKSLSESIKEHGK